MNNTQNITTAIILYIPVHGIASCYTADPQLAQPPRSLPSSSVDRSSALLPFLKTPHACHPEQDSKDGRLLTAAKEKGSCAGGVEVSVARERAEEKGGKILTLQNLKSPNQVLTRLLREVWPLMPPGWAPRQPGSSPQRALSPGLPRFLCVGCS